jgi:hypothetical protein
MLVFVDMFVHVLFAAMFVDMLVLMLVHAMELLLVGMRMRLKRSFLFISVLMLAHLGLSIHMYHNKITYFII